MQRMLPARGATWFRKTTFLLFLLLAQTLTLSAQKWRLVQPAYATGDAPVIAYSVADDGATGDGVTDVTNIFQQRLDTLGIIGGGTLFVPKGKYVIRGTLRIPKGVTLRGEWQQPVKGQPIVGSILMAYAGRGNESSDAFISVGSSAAVMDLAIWYPEQLPDNITPYPPAIGYGLRSVGTGVSTNTRNVTLVNAYSGVVCITGGSVPNIDGLYGTPLSRGVEIDGQSDVGHIQNVHLAPGYWSGSGLPNAPAAGSGFEGWMRQNGQGFIMRRNDWTYTSFMNIEGYHIGYHAQAASYDGVPPNAQNYGINITNCETGIYAEALSPIGVLFSRVVMTGCTTGLSVAGGNSDGTLQLHTCTISGSIAAVSTDPACKARIIAQQCTFNGGKVDIEGGTFMPSDCDFNNTTPQLTFGQLSRGVVTGNRFKAAKSIRNNSDFVSVIDTAAVSLPRMPAFPAITQTAHQPSRKVLYVVTDAPYNALHDGKTDNTSAVQAALNKASADGGGVVFLPPGKYEFNGHLSVPAGVELKGASDLNGLPMGQGAILEPHADKGQASGTPFITLAAGSGIRGVTINYPEQVYANYPANVAVYPYAIRGGGSNVYIVNVALRACYQGVDLFTNKCDNHYVDYLSGHVLKSGIRVGKASANGQICNAQVNPVAFAVGSDAEWGAWPNSAPISNNGVIYEYNHDNQDFMTLGNCTGEVLFNNFVYGPHNAVLFLNDGTGANGSSLGTEIDGSYFGINLQGMSSKGFDFINMGVIATAPDGDTASAPLITTSTFAAHTFNVYNAAFTGYPAQTAVMNGGTINIQSAGFIQAGRRQLADLKSGMLSLYNCSVWPGQDAIVRSGQEARFAAQSSIIDSTNISPAKTAAFKDNTSNAFIADVKGALDRHGWQATASLNSTRAQSALDSTLSTRWDSGAEQAPGMTFTVDMKTMNTIHKIVMDASPSINDFPAAYAVLVSKDSVHWSSAIASDGGIPGMSLISFPDTVCRYVRIVQTGSKGSFWSIHEFYVFGKVNVTGVSIVAPLPVLRRDTVVKLSALVTPANATNKGITWSSEDPAVITVDTTGKLHAVGSGKTVIRVTSLDAGLFATDTITVTGGLAPYLGAPAAIPGTIEAEYYDFGGEGVAYHDNDATNNGGNQFRPSEGVDAEVCGEGGYDVGATEPGEWLKYSVNILKDGIYTLQIRTASPNNGCKLQVEMDSTVISGGMVNLPNTGGWQTYQTATVTTPLLRAGAHVMRVLIGSYGFNFNYVRFVDATGTTTAVKNQPEVVVFPNPVTTATIGLQLANFPAGRCRLILLNTLGQQVMQTQLVVSGDRANYNWPLAKKPAAGYYFLQVISAKGTSFTRAVSVP